MAFTPEDGTGLADANALADVAFADGYFTERGIAAWTGSDTLKEQALVRATDYIETRWGNRGKFKGCVQFPDTPQALSFPRTGIGSDGAVPIGVRKAAAEYALRALTVTLAPDPVTQPNGQTVAMTRRKLGPLETEVRYHEAGSVAVLKPYPAADMLLRPYLLLTGGLLRT